MLVVLATLTLCCPPQEPPPPAGDPPRASGGTVTATATARVRVAGLGLRIVEDGDARRVLVGDDLFTVLRSDAAHPMPVLYPLLGPDQVAMTRSFPFERDDPRDATDHPHHRSVWFAHGAMNGHDFWHGTGSNDHVVLDAWLPVPEAERQRSVRARYRWLAEDGSLVCTDERLWRFGVLGDGSRHVDIRVALHAPDAAPVRFGDTKEGTMAVRVAPSLRLKGEHAAGSILTSEGVRDGEAWGKRAAWVAYSGPCGEPEAEDPSTYTVVLMDHPGNLRHPCWWHARDYGLLAANPFGIHDFERKPAGAGDHELAAGGTLTFTYRLALLRGAADAEDLATRFAAFAAERLPTFDDDEDDDR